MLESITARFAAQAALHPARMAVKGATGEVSYGALHQRASAVAAAITRRGGPGGAPVAILMHHDVPLIAAILGVLQAGRIVLCLDRSQPAAWLGHMLADAQPFSILSDDFASDVERVGAFESALVEVDAIASDAEVDLGPGPAPLDEALLFYTSGSSARPKGVVQNHRSVVHGSVTHAEVLGVSSADRLALLHACSSAASRSMLFGGLLTGATVCPFDVRREGTPAMVAWLRRERITVCHMVPSLFRQFASSLDQAPPLPALRLIRLGGEGATMADVDLYRRHFPGSCTLINGFGGTEIGINACSFRVDHGTVLPGGLVPVGYAAAGVDLLLQHEDGRPAAVGEVGEIVVRSPYLSSGYWRDPEASRSAFAPLTPGDATPAYRTGDVGRFDASGCLTHLGRTDQQVKIRGHRCNLVDIEAAVQQVEGVLAAAVTTRPGPSGDLQLVAFFVPATADGPSASAVLRHLVGALPRPMIPSAAVAVAALPALAGGKVDRQALTSMAAERCGEALRAPTPVAGGDLVQLQLKGIWERALSLDSVGVDDDFFALGGDSFAAASICSMIDRAFRMRLPLVTLTETPTIADLARLIRAREEPASWSPLVALQTRGPHPPIYCVPGAGSDVFALRDLARHLAPDQPLYGLQPRGLDGRAPFHRTIESAAAYYLEAIREHQTVGPYYLAGTSLGGTIAFEMARQLEAAGQAVGPVLLLDAHGPGYPRVSRSLGLSGRALVCVRAVMPRYLASLVAEAQLQRTLTSSLLRQYLSMAARYWLAKAYVSAPHGWLARPFALRFECLQAVLFAARARYVARPVRGRLELFRTLHHPGDALFEPDTELGWHGLAHAGVGVRVIPGVHSQHIREPHVGELATQMRSCLAQARAAAHHVSAGDVAPLIAKAHT